MGPFQMGTVIGTAYDENGMLGVQTDGMGANPTAHARYHVGMFGYLARPLPTTLDSEGAACLFVDEGSEGFAWIGADDRDLARMPLVSSGSNGIANSLGAFYLADYETETTTIYQPILGSTTAHKILIGVDGEGAPTIDILHSSKACLTFTDDEVTLRHSGNGLIKIKGDAVEINGTFNVGASFTVGGLAAQSVPVMPGLLAYLSALEELLGVMGTDITAKTPAPGVPPPPPSAAAVAAFVAASGALKTAMASQMIKGI
jgi:hypothetical protein